MAEDRKIRFRKLAEKRTNVVLEKLRILGNLSNRANYDYSDEEVNRIFYAIETHVKNVKARFVSKRKREFRL